MQRVLVVGASGLLGQHMMRTGQEMGLSMTGTYHGTMPVDMSDMVRMDITDQGSVVQGLEAARPDLVVLSAAMTNVDQCEREPDKAYEVNMEGALNVAAACKAAGAKMAYVSTDYVFNGLKRGRYRESDPPDPLSVYARSKLEGERVTMDADPGNLVCRVSVVYGWNRNGPKGNFVTWIIDSLRKGNAISLYRDQHVSPTYAPAAARDILELAARGTKGVYHTSGPDCLSRLEIGDLVAEVFGLDGKLINAVDTRDLPMLAVRPSRSCLAVDHAEAELGRSMTSMRRGLEDMRSEGP
jgi:dTDP-4-dehydrorhamnose reductase